MPIENRCMFQRQHHNAIAKDIRESYPVGLNTTDLVERRILEELAIRFAIRFKIDNENFDPIKFLLACSPDTDLYPLGELWDDENG